MFVDYQDDILFSIFFEDCVCSPLIADRILSPVRTVALDHLLDSHKQFVQTSCRLRVEESRALQMVTFLYPSDSSLRSPQNEESGMSRNPVRKVCP